VAQVRDLVLGFASAVVLLNQALGEQAHQLAAGDVAVGERGEQPVDELIVAVELALRRPA